MTVFRKLRRKSSDGKTPAKKATAGPGRPRKDAHSAEPVQEPTPEAGPKVVWQPNPGPQTSFHRRREFEVLYGGAAGGGKSDSLLVEALRQVARPRYRAILFRRTYPEAQQLMDRSSQLYPAVIPGAKWRDRDFSWIFPSGARIRFGYLQHLGDERKYQGHEYQFIGFDELTHFHEKQYLYLFSRCRTSDPNLRCYMRSTTNPGGFGHAWVKGRFVDVAPPGVTYRDPATGLSRVFIPARLFDNPKLMEADPQYLVRLRSLQEDERRALLEGDWDAFSGQVFTEFRRERHEVTPFEIPQGWIRFRSMDWGFARPYSVHWHAVDFDGVIWTYRELYGMKPGQPNVGTQETADVVAARVRTLEEGERIAFGVADPSIWARTGHTGPTIAEEFARAGVHWNPADNDRIQGKQQVHYRLRGWGEDLPGVRIFSTCTHLLRTLPALTYDEQRVEDVDTEAEDHAYDDFRYACMSRPWKPVREERKARDAWAEERKRDSWMGI